jgi:hypothetical protein
MVGTMQIKLDPKPWQRPSADGPPLPRELPDTDVLTLNSGDLVFVLINAVKELATKVEALSK